VAGANLIQIGFASLLSSNSGDTIHHSHASPPSSSLPLGADHVKARLIGFCYGIQARHLWRVARAGRVGGGRFNVFPSRLAGATLVATASPPRNPGGRMDKSHLTRTPLKRGPGTGCKPVLPPALKHGPIPRPKAAKPASPCPQASARFPSAPLYIPILPCQGEKRVYSLYSLGFGVGRGSASSFFAPCFINPARGGNVSSRRCNLRNSAHRGINPEDVEPKAAARCDPFRVWCRAPFRGFHHPATHIIALRGKIKQGSDPLFAWVLSSNPKPFPSPTYDLPPTTYSPQKHYFFSSGVRPFYYI